MRKNESKLIKAFGKDEYGFAELPTKVSGVIISRLLVGEMMGCTFCFPHGQCTCNSRYDSVQRSWKTHRKTQYK